jgi:RNA polymerase primary sigma factor
MARKSAASLGMKEGRPSRILTREQEAALARRLQKGDLLARDELILCNQYLVLQELKHFKKRGLSEDDLFQQGCLGLLRAVEKYDPSLGCPFAYYARWWIRQAIQRSLINAVNAVEIPAYMVEMISKWGGTANRLEGETGRPPTQDEIARAMGLSRKKVEVISRAARAFSSPFQAVTDDAEWSLSDMVPDDEARSPADVLLENRRKEAVMRFLNSIDTRAATVLRMRFGIDGGEPMTLKDIGRKIGLTRERVRQIERDALKCINEAIRSQEGEMTSASAAARA